MEQNVLLEINGPVAEIVLNRPGQRNAVNGPLLDDLREALLTVEADEAVRVALIRGAGPAFCAGNDLKERSAMSLDELRARRAKGRETYTVLDQFTKPCIAVVHGAAIAAGSEIALACDFILAGESATFRYPVGVRGSVGDALRLTKVAGKPIAKEILLTGRIVKATEPLALRFINHVVPDDELLEFARNMAASIAEHDPDASINMKRAINTGQAADPVSAARMEQQALDAAKAFQRERGQ